MKKEQIATETKMKRQILALENELSLTSFGEPCLTATAPLLTETSSAQSLMTSISSDRLSQIPSGIKRARSLQNQSSAFRSLFGTKLFMMTLAVLTSLSMRCLTLFLMVALQPYGELDKFALTIWMIRAKSAVECHKAQLLQSKAHCHMAPKSWKQLPKETFRRTQWPYSNFWTKNLHKPLWRTKSRW